MKENRIKGVVFDWAGTIVDYGCLAPVEGIRSVFRQRGIFVEGAEIRLDMGLAKGDHIRKLLAKPHIEAAWRANYGMVSQESDIPILLKELEEKLVNVLAQYSLPVPGVLDVFAELRQRKIRIGTSTGYTASIMKVVEAVAKEYGLQPDALVTSSDVPAGRPHPFMCYANAIRLGVYPLWQMVKIGDTIADMQEGKNAGMWTVGVVKGGNQLGLSLEEMNALNPEELQARSEAAVNELKAAGADYVIEELRELIPVIDDIEGRLHEGSRPA